MSNRLYGRRAIISEIDRLTARAIRLELLCLVMAVVLIIEVYK